MDPNVPFSDTSARRAELMEATEQYKSRIETNVSSLKGDASEVGKTVAIVAGVSLAVYLIASLILPKDRDQDEEEAYYDEDADEYYPQHSQKAMTHRATKAAESAPKKSAISGAIMGIVTSIATAYAKDQALKYVSRFTQNNASKQPYASGRQTQPSPYQSVYP
ncbi:hypothetical protein [Tellurirhabdus rosea]|uniref:hypothetical protein n=1 Tax=Tellurirhabdus rosea TaxID=2674997 RepID=UPI002257553C|nr:hypothetical protein [Tellurirhabdus rosea]